MSSIYVIIETEDPEPTRCHGVFTTLEKAVDAVPNVVKRRDEGVLTINEQVLDTVFRCDYWNAIDLFEGTLAVYDTTGKLLEDKRPASAAGPGM